MSRKKLPGMCSSHRLQEWIQGKAAVKGSSGLVLPVDSGDELGDGLADEILIEMLLINQANQAVPAQIVTGRSPRS